MDRLPERVGYTFRVYSKFSETINETHAPDIHQMTQNKLEIYVHRVLFRFDRLAEIYKFAFRNTQLFTIQFGNVRTANVQ